MPLMPRILSNWTTALVEGQIMGILVFLIEREKLSPSVNEMKR
jgi:hypothetical protein